jgi:D-alanine-D-alanine ligase
MSIMTRSKPVSVVVLYNIVGEDDYEILRKKVENGEVTSPTGDITSLENVATIREEIEAIAEGLREKGFEAAVVNIEDRFDRLMETLTSPRPDVVFNLVESFNEDPRQEDRVAALYDLLRIPYTGSPPMALSICQRKGITKQILEALGVPIPKYVIVRERPIPRRFSRLSYPLIIKPAWEDASQGVDEGAVVDDRKHLVQRVEMILDEFNQPALVEEFIEGRELGVSVLGNETPEVLPIEEMDFSGLPERFRGILSFESKWEPLSEVFHMGELVCPADLTESVEKRVREIALRTYQALGVRDYARIDMRLGKNNRLYVLEVNPNPDLTEGVAFMASAKAAGYSFSEILEIIVGEALMRGERARPAAEPSLKGERAPA